MKYFFNSLSRVPGGKCHVHVSTGSSSGKVKHDKSKEKNHSLERSYLNEDEHTGDEDEGHVEPQELQQRQRETAFVRAPLYSWRHSAKAEQCNTQEKPVSLEYIHPLLSEVFDCNKATHLHTAVIFTHCMQVSQLAATLTLTNCI